MATAEELLRSASLQPEPEGHIVVGGNRFITIPSSLKRLGVQYDHNMETVTFDCPRYWDDRDMSKMAVYINYRLSNGYMDRYPADNVRADGDIIHFEWTISRNVTQVPGNVSFLVCIMKTDAEGNEDRHWNSELCQDAYISPGMETEESPVDTNPDLITQLLLRMDSVEQIIGAVSEEDIIIDVPALPETDINKNAFYRLMNGSFICNGAELADMYCYVVEELPDQGTPVLYVVFEDGDPDPSNHRYVIWLDGMHIYHNLSNGEQYAYLDDEAAGLIGGDPGWRILDDATVQAGHHYIGDYGGLLTTSLDDASPNTTYLVLHEEVYYYHYNNGGFVSISDNTGGGGSITVTDDGNGNVTITASAGVTITDDGNGNVTIE